MDGGKSIRSVGPILEGTWCDAKLGEVDGVKLTPLAGEYGLQLGGPITSLGIFQIM